MSLGIRRRTDGAATSSFFSEIFERGLLIGCSIITLADARGFVSCKARVESMENNVSRVVDNYRYSIPLIGTTTCVKKNAPCKDVMCI